MEVYVVSVHSRDSYDCAVVGVCSSLARAITLFHNEIVRQDYSIDEQYEEKIGNRTIYTYYCGDYIVMYQIEGAKVDDD